MQNYNKKSDFARIIAKKSVPLQSEIKISETMTQEQEEQLERLLKGIDISDVLKVASERGNRYNRRILKFFRWFCKWAPVFIMCVHVFGMLEFAHHEGNDYSYQWKYRMLSVHLPHGVHNADDNNIGEQVLLSLLEIPHSVPVLLRGQRYTHRPRQYIHD